VAEQEVVAMQEIVQTRQQTAPPPPPAPPIPVEVANDVIIDDEEVDFDASLDLTETLAVAGPPAPEADGEAEAEEEMDIFVAVEQMPEMIGGTAKLMSDLTYPSLAVKAGLEGTVIVQVVVGEDGVPRQPMVVRSGGQLLDEAAVAAVMKQRFHPGKQRNEAVPVRMAIPVRFALT
jgi:protein TonB